MKPNDMPKKSNKLREQLLAGLISISPAVWEQKKLVKDEDGKEQVETTRVVRSVLRYPLAYNMSDENVERLAKKWL